MFTAFTRWKERANLVEEQLDCMEHKLDVLVKMVRALAVVDPDRRDEPVKPRQEEEKAVHEADERGGPVAPLEDG